MGLYCVLGLRVSGFVEFGASGFGGFMGFGALLGLGVYWVGGMSLLFYRALVNVGFGGLFICLRVPGWRSGSLGALKASYL